MAFRRRFLTSVKSENSTSCTHGCSLPSLPQPFYSAASNGDYHSDQHITANIIIAGVSVACAVLFLLLTYYTVLIRRSRGEDLSYDGNSGASDSEEGEGDHALWHIRTVGLHDSAISSITAKPCIAGAGSAAACSVCLNDFCEGELVRLLPTCGHCFHVSCIDTWLRAHISCPLCRASVFDSISALPSCVGIVESVAAEENVQTSDHRILEALEEDVGAAVTDTSMDDTDSGTDRHRGDLPGNVLRQELRSNSMGSFLANDSSFRTDREGRSLDGINLNREKGGIRLIEERLQKNREFVRGSTSSSGRFIFFSRHRRSRSSSVLPL